MSAVVERVTVTVQQSGRADGSRDPGHVIAACSCGWRGVLHSTRTVEGHDLAERDADDHRYAHEHNTGFFDYGKGWVAPVGGVQ